MINKKPQLEYQKQRLELAIDEISTPIFSTKIRNVSDNQRFSRLSDTYSAKSQPNSENAEIRPETAVGNPAFSTIKNALSFAKSILHLELLGKNYFNPKIIFDAYSIFLIIYKPNINILDIDLDNRIYFTNC